MYNRKCSEQVYTLCFIEDLKQKEYVCEKVQELIEKNRYKYTNNIYINHLVSFVHIVN